ncbi:MAG: GNAT family N-acetyltransferase [Proteobacteria bacterium]|nr:GNAT family N-acetyltransferase [Pseudomonadota bacterium]
MSDISDLTLRPARAADAQSIYDLLQRSGLPASDLSTARPEFVMAEHAGQLVGIGALEHFGNAALLRSVAVEPQWRGSGAGRLIVANLEQRARAAGIDELILLTLTARDFFARLGYGPKRRDRVPPAVLGSAEFRSLCPASASCMAKCMDPN